MNLILLVVLGALAFFFLQSGLTFLAVLIFALMILALLSSGFSKQSGAPENLKISEPYGPEGPIVVENKMPDVPKLIKFKIKNDWHDYRQFEYSFFNFGSAMHNVGNFLVQWIFGLRPPKKDH